MADTLATKPPHFARRADIQSLRALSIALVVAAHARVPGLQGGFVGVDVFFVLSGYLISGLILMEAETTGRFRAWAFYARRLKRLLPALFLVLIVTAVVAWVVVIPRQLDDATAGRAANLWLSNFYFAARQINYFSAGGGSNLFLHTWSLAVEEQFYVVWPWLLLFLYGIWTWQGRPRSHKRVAIGLVLVALLSLALGFYWSRTDVEVGFYLMPGRMWEFALGALVFLLRRRIEAGKHPRIERWMGRSLFNVSGWLLILAASALYSNALRFPGLWAFLPCAGAALVLLDAPERRPHGIVARVLTRQPMVQFIGNISYSLYLWHWPVLLLGAALFGQSAPVRFALVALSVALAAATYFAVENPIRRLRVAHPLRVLVPSAAAITLGVVAMNFWFASTVAMLRSPRQFRIERARFDAPNIYASGSQCDTWYHSSRVIPCVYGSSHARHTVAMFGDSVLAQWLPAIRAIYLKKPGWKVAVLTKSACPASQVSFYYTRIKAQYTVCDTWRKRAINYLVRMHPDVVIMGSARYPFTRSQWIQGTRATLKRLSTAVRRVVVLNPTPMLGFNGPDCLEEQTERPRWLAFASKCSRTIKPAAQDGIYGLLHEAAKPYRNVQVINLDASICPQRRCRARIGSSIVYRDGQHLTASYASSLAPALQLALSSSGQLN